MRYQFAKLSLVLPLILLSMLSACGGGTGLGNTGGGEIQEITIGAPSGFSSSQAIPAGDTVQFSATALMAGGGDVNVTDTVTWTSMNSAVATVNGDGLVTIRGVGSTTITATKSGKSAQITVTGGAAAAKTMSVSPKTASVPLGKTQQFTASAVYTDGTTHDVSASAVWTSSAAAVASVNSTGLVTSLVQGNTTITATLGSLSAQATITVSSHVVVTITISPASPAIPLGETQQFTATATFSDGITLNITSLITWSASPSSVLTIDSNGLAHSVGKGSFILSGSASGQSANVAGTVTNPAATGIAVSPSNASIAKDSTQTFHANATLSDGTTQDVSSSATWQSSNTAVATVSGGVASGVAAGSAQITATYSTFTSSAALTVTGTTVTSVTVAPSSTSIAKGTTAQFSATANLSDGSTQTVTASATWGSSIPSVATINGIGLASGAGIGSTSISAQYGGRTGTASLTVTAPTVVSVAIAPSTPSIPLGKTQQFTATATYTDGTTGDVTSSTTWSASPSSVLTIDANGLAHSVGKGSFSLTGTAGGQSTNITGAVVNAVATGVQVNPGLASIPKGSTQTFHAVATFSDGTTQDVSSSTSWQSSNTAVATVDSTGIASAVAIGAAQISGNYQTFSASALLTVTNATVSGVSVTVPASSLAKGTNEQATATATLSDGSTQNVTNSSLWSSSSISVALVGLTGSINAINTGNATISALYGGKTGSTPITVTAATLTSVAITPTNPTATSGGTLQLQAIGTFSDGTTQDVTSSLLYASSNILVANVDSNGVLHGLLPGTATITASKGSFSMTFTVTITSAVLEGITVTPASPTVVAGSTQQFTATGSFSDGSTQDLTTTVNWTSSSNIIASVDSNGVATGSSAGVTVITATSGLVVGTAELTVSPATITVVTVAPLLATITAGQTQAFTATATLSDETSQDVTASAHWSVSNSTAASISNTAGTAGTATGKAAGATTVTATVDTVSGTASLVVSAATVVSVSVNPATVSIALGIPTNLTATATYSDGSTADVTATANWSSSSGSIVSVVAGLVTPLLVGNSTVSATIGGQTGSAAVTVTPATLSSIAISPGSISLAAGLTSQLTATGTFSDGGTQNITSSVHWTSSVGAVATIGSTGLILSITPGSTVVTATLGSVTKTVNVTVSAAILQSINVTAPQSSVALGFTLQLTATGNYSDGSTQNLTSTVQWSSTNATIALVNSLGVVSGLLAGSFTANATSQGVTGSLAVTISPATLVSLSVSPSGLLSVLLAHQMTLTGHFSDGTTQTITSGIHWSVSNSLLATISQTGLLLPITLGNLTVTASYGSLTGQVTISLF